MIETICPKCRQRYQVGTDHKCPKESGAVAERDGGKPTRNATAKHVAPVLPTSADESAVDAGSNPAGSAKFNKTAYQKAYMVGWRKRRAEAKKVKSLMDGNK